MESSNFSIEESLQLRLGATRDERVALKSTIDTLDARIKYLIGQVKVRPRETDEELIEAIKAAEFYHATHPQSNSDERLFMRDIDKLKKKRKELAEYNILQAQIDEHKSKRTIFLNDLREKETNLNELYKGSRKLKAAALIGCEPSDVNERTITVPEDKLSQIIGRSGSNVKQIESECKVAIDVDRVVGGMSRIRILGSEAGMQAAQQRIQLILDTLSEEFAISEASIVCLLMDKAALLNELQNQSSARIDLSRASGVCRVTGVQAEVTRATASIKGIRSASVVIKLDRSAMAYLLGKGGSVIRSLETEHHVNIDVNRGGGGGGSDESSKEEKDKKRDNRDRDSGKGKGVAQSTPVAAAPPADAELSVRITGLTSNVDVAHAVLRDIIEENKEVFEELWIEKQLYLKAIIGSKGATIRQLQKDLNVSLNKQEFIDDKSSKKGVMNFDILLLKGTPRKVNSAKLEVIKLLDEHVKRCHVAPFPREQVPYVVGKKGAKINSLREDFKNTTFEIIDQYDPDSAQALWSLTDPNVQSSGSNSRAVSRELEYAAVRIYCEGDEERRLALDAVQKIVSENQIFEFPMNLQTIITLKGARGSSVRNYIQNDLKLNLDIEEKNEMLHLRGEYSVIKDGIARLQEFADSNYYVENPCDEDDVACLLSGGMEKCLLTQIMKSYGIEIFVNRKDLTVKFVGPKSSVNDAYAYMTGLFAGTLATGESILLEVSADRELGLLIGKGGGQVRQFETKHDVKIDILRIIEQIRIRGSAEKVKQAKEDILFFLAEIRVIEEFDSCIYLDSTNWSSDVVVLKSVAELIASREGVLSAMSGSTSNNSSREGKLLTAFQLFQKTKRLFGVDVEVEGTERIVVSGAQRNVFGGKKYIIDDLVGTAMEYVPLLDHQLQYFTTKENLGQLETTARVSGVYNVAVDVRKKHIAIIGATDRIAKAKIQIYRMLDFVFPSELSSIPADSVSLLDLWSTKTDSVVSDHFPGAHVAFDIPMSCIRINCMHTLTTRIASDYFWTAVSNCRKKRVVIDLDHFKDAELMDLLVAKKAVALGPIENQCSVSIRLLRDVSEPSWGVLISHKANEPANSKKKKGSNIGSTAEEGKTHQGGDKQQDLDAIERQLQSAKIRVLAAMELLQKENWRVVLKGEAIGRLVGKQGAHIKSLREETKANIDLDMHSGVVKVTGKEPAVADAKARILKFIDKFNDENNSIEIAITSDSIPVIIGTKGSTVKSLREGSGVRDVSIDRNRNVVVLTGSSASCASASKSIHSLLAQAGIDLAKVSISADDKAKVSSKEDPGPCVAPEADGKVSVPVHKMHKVREGNVMSKSALRRLRRRDRAGVGGGDEEDEGAESEDQAAGSEDASQDLQPAVAASAVATRVAPPALVAAAPRPPSPPPVLVPPVVGTHSNTSLLLNSGSLLGIVHGGAHSIPTGAGITTNLSQPEKLSAVAPSNPPSNGYFKSKSGLSIRLS